MGRRRRRQSSAETIDFANDALLDLIEPVERVVSPVDRLDEFIGDSLPYDRRAFSFGVEPERYTLSYPVEPLITSRVPESELSHRVAFSDPSTVAICHRRQVRKEVLHALRRTRKGGGGKRSWKSNIKC